MVLFIFLSPSVCLSSSLSPFFFCFVSISRFNLLRIAKRIIEITQRGGKAQCRAVQDRAHND